MPQAAIPAPTPPKSRLVAQRRARKWRAKTGQINHGRQAARWGVFTVQLKGIPTIAIVNFVGKGTLCRGICETQENRPRYFKFYIPTSIPYTQVKSWLQTNPNFILDAYNSTSLENKEDFKYAFYRSKYKMEILLKSRKPPNAE